LKLVSLLESLNYKVFISSESDKIADVFKPYLLKSPPENIHHIMAFASLLITEGATMASESAMLGVPALYVNSLDAGTLRDLEDKYQLIYGFRTPENVLEKTKEILNNPLAKELYQNRRKKLLSETIDPTTFLINLSEKLNHH
jgi:predicted glycosyltransferase